jgi:predicted amidophosphoribosyltransferase
VTRLTARRGWAYPSRVQPSDAVVCSDCGSEFQPHVTRCIDCGAPTRPAEAGSEPHRKEKPPFSLSRESPARGLCQETGLGRAESLASFLEEHGIPCRIEVSEVDELRSRQFYYLICVPEEDVERAFELRHEHLLIENPEIADELDALLPEIEQCPACGSRVSPDNPDCPSCGLTLD